MGVLQSEIYRPFSKIVSIAASSTSSVSFTDTAGSALPSTYISVVMAAAISNAGYFTVTLSSVGSNPNPSSLGGASGTIGGGGTVVDPVEIRLGGPDAALGVTINSQAATTLNFLVTYGVRTHPNPLRDAVKFGGA